MKAGPADEVLDIYARVSRLGDDRQRSTDGQVRDSTERIEDRGATVGEVHIDSGRSAWNQRIRRPGWDRLMERLETGATGGVVVFDLARFSRKPRDGERLIEAAENGLLVLDADGEYDLTSPSGKKNFRDQLSSAAYESDRLSRRVQRGKRLKAVSGESNASSRAFGFEIDGAVRKSEADVLRDLVERFLAGESQNSLVRWLNASDIKTSTGGPWSNAGLRQVLTRPRNANLVEYLGEVVAPLTTEEEPILDKAVWERVVATFAARRAGRPISDTYLCSGIMKCGLCGHHLTGRPRKNMAPYPDGSVKREYWCQPRARDGGCGRLAADQRAVDKYVGILAVRILSDKRHAAAVEAAARSVNDQRQKLDAEITDLETLADELAGRLGRREIDLRRYDAAVGPLERDLVILRARREQIASDPNAGLEPVDVSASRAEWQRRWDAAETPERRALLRQALRGRRLLLMPADPSAPRRFNPERILVEDSN